MATGIRKRLEKVAKSLTIPIEGETDSAAARLILNGVASDLHSRHVQKLLSGNGFTPAILKKMATPASVNGDETVSHNNQTNGTGRRQKKVLRHGKGKGTFNRMVRR